MGDSTRTRPFRSRPPTAPAPRAARRPEQVPGRSAGRGDGLRASPDGDPQLALLDRELRRSPTPARGRSPRGCAPRGLSPTPSLASSSPRARARIVCSSGSASFPNKREQKQLLLARRQPLRRLPHGSSCDGSDACGRRAAPRPVPTTGSIERGGTPYFPETSRRTSSTTACQRWAERTWSSACEPSMRADGLVERRPAALGPYARELVEHLVQPLGAGRTSAAGRRAERRARRTAGTPPREPRRAATAADTACPRAPRRRAHRPPRERRESTPVSIGRSRPSDWASASADGPVERHRNRVDRARDRRSSPRAPSSAAASARPAAPWQ